MADEVIVACPEEYARYLQESAGELRRVADRCDDIAAVFRTARRVELEGPPEPTTEEAPPVRVWDVTPEAIAAYSQEEFLGMAFDHVSVPHLTAACDTCTLINKRQADAHV